jgi:hypothetical protein
VAAEQIAEAALDGPALCAGDSESLAPLLRGVSQLLAVPVADVQIVGSARFGFSLRDGAAFDPAFSDLDLAIVNAGLYQRCSAPTSAPAGAAPAGAEETPFQHIVDAGLPQYLLPIAASTPGNASPWLADRAAFERAFGGSSLRRVRLAALGRALADLAQVVQVHCCLVGGSFVDVSNAVPNDLDIVVFYSARADVRFEPGRALQRLTRKFLLEHIDMRFVPCDAEPWLMVKLTSYFTQLYQSRRPGTDVREHGLVLLLPGTGTGQ